MTIELWMLFGSVIIGIVQVSAQSMATKWQVGNQWTVGARDQPRPLTGVPARLERALRNFQESFPLFAALILMAHLTGGTDRLTAIGAQMFFYARAAYVPIYAAGVPWVRTVVWQVATVGLVLVAIGVAW
jgi:uncharacterized MAPEG superfamily protein